MPRELSSTVTTELGLTTFAAPIYCIRITRRAGVLRWSERNPTFDDGTPSQTYEARLAQISGFDFGADEAGAITITVLNGDGQVTTLDRAESFAGAKCELLAYLPGIDAYYMAWSGFCGEVSEITQELATIPAYPALANPHVHIPRRQCGLACTHIFGVTDHWRSVTDFEGSECPYQRVSTIGFVTVINDAGGISAGDTTFTVTKLADSRRFRINDEIKVTKVATPGAPGLTPSASGGSLASATYYYKIAALNDTGETVGGTEASTAVTGPTGSVALTWSAVTGATKYRIYRGTSSNGQDRYYETTGTSYTDTGATATLRAPLGNTTAYREVMLVTAAAAPGASTQQITVTRARRGTTAIAHADGADVAFRNCRYSAEACNDRGMYGNNSSDTYSAGSKKRNYFGGFPFISGYQHGNYRSSSAERAKPLRLVFSGNESAYGRLFALPYGRVRISDPVLLVAKPEGDFLTTLFAVCEGVLATTASNESQATPGDAYIKTSGVENIFVNGVSRHDPRPGYGIEVYNGDQDRAEPASVFFPAGAGQINDFITNNLGFWGTARFVLRINTKNNPSVDLKGQSVTGAVELAYGRIHRVYTDAATYVRRATADGSNPGADPAFVLMDLMSAQRAGGGLDYGRFNIQSYVDTAAYCDEEITSTFDGATVKRWTFNGVIDQRKSYAEWVHLVSLGAYFLPPFLDKDGKLKIKALKSESLSGIPVFSSKVASATGRNILWNGNASGLVKQRRKIEEIPNQIQVNFIDKADYARVSVTIADRDSQTDLGKKLGDSSLRVISKSIDLPGTSTLDEASRIGTLILRAGEFAQGGLSNNLKVVFNTLYRDSEDLEIGDVIEVEDDLLSAAENERYFRVTRVSSRPIPVEDGGFVFGREIEAVLHDNAIYDDTALTVSKFDRIDAADSSDKEPPAVTDFVVSEDGVVDENDVPTTRITIDYVEPDPLENFRSLMIFVSNDDGGGDPVGDWRYVTDLHQSGESFQFEVSGLEMHFAGVSRPLSGHVPDIDTLDDAGLYKYPRSMVVVDGVTDADVPDAPTVGVTRSQAQRIIAQYNLTIGVDNPGSPDNWNRLRATQIQISTDPSFGTFPTGKSLNTTYKNLPPFTIEFSTNYPGTYYIRARVQNALGFGAWGTTNVTTDQLDSLTDDTDLLDGPTPSLSGTGTSKGGNEISIAFTIPTAQTSTYWGYAFLFHNSSTLPTATTHDTGTAGELTAGVAVLTDATKAFGVNALAGKDVVIFSEKRQASPSYDYEGMIVMARILSNTATTITFDAKSQNLHRTRTGLKYYIVNAGAGHHFFEKLTRVTPWYLDPAITLGLLSAAGQLRSETFAFAFSPVHCWVILNNVYGTGKATATPPNATPDGIATAEVKNLAITTGKLADLAVTTGKLVDDAVSNVKLATDAVTTTKIADNQISTPKLIALSVTTAKIDALAVTAAKVAAWTISAVMLEAGTVTAGTFIGTTFKTASSGSRVEIDSTNGLRVYDSGGTVRSQLAISGGVAGYLTTDAIWGNVLLALYADSAGATSILLQSGAITVDLGSGDIFQVDINSTIRAKVDDADSSTQTALLVRQDGSLRRVKTQFVAQDTWGAGSPPADINVLYVN